MSYTGDNMLSVKRTNRSAVLRLLHEQQELSRKRLAEATRLTPAAITKITAELMAEGLVREGKSLPSESAGRREVRLELDMDARCALGILLNRGQSVLSAARLDGKVLFSEEIPLSDHAPADKTLELLCGRLMELAREHGLSREKLLGVGVAVRGVTEADGRRVRNSFGALAERDYPLAERVETLTGLPVVLANNVRSLFAAQMFLAGDRQQRSQFFLRCEYGIGASLSVDGRIWHGGSEQCSEIGHIPVVKTGGKLCVCGKRGCLETIASPGAIVEEAEALLSPEATPSLWQLHRDRAEQPLRMEEITRAAEAGDAAVGALLDHAVSALGDALKAVIYLIDPEKIVLYGSLFEDPFYLGRLQREMRSGVDEGRRVALEKSPFNLLLETCAAPLLMIERFYETGGL